MRVVDVDFTKGSGRRYYMEVRRERGPVLAARQAPGYDDALPHEVVHFIVEAEAGLTGGVFGRVASGRSQIFWPEDQATARKQRRREAKHPLPRSAGRDMQRSESLVGVCTALWERKVGRRAELPAWFDLVATNEPPSELTDRIVERLDTFAAMWQAIPVGGTVTLHWPDRAQAPSR